MQPIRTYTAVVHGQDVTVKVYPATEPKHVAWVTSTATERHNLQIDETVCAEPAAPKHVRTVDMNDCEE